MKKLLLLILVLFSCSCINYKNVTFQRSTGTFTDTMTDANNPSIEIPEIIDIIKESKQ